MKYGIRNTSTLNEIVGGTIEFQINPSLVEIPTGSSIEELQ
jgi:hypothetical protein